MIGLSGAAGAVLVLCGQVRSALERKGLPRRELAGGRVRIEPRYNQGSGFGLFPLKARQMAVPSLAALLALLGISGGRGPGGGIAAGRRTQQPVGTGPPRPGAGLPAFSQGPGAAEEVHL